VAARYFTGEDAQEAKANEKVLAELSARLSARELERSREIAGNLSARIEERRKTKPLHAGPGEDEV
jgi:hypothetical protein